MHQKIRLILERKLIILSDEQILLGFCCLILLHFDLMIYSGKLAQNHHRERNLDITITTEIVS